MLSRTIQRVLGTVVKVVVRNQSPHAVGDDVHLLVRIAIVVLYGMDEEIHSTHVVNCIQPPVVGKYTEASLMRVLQRHTRRDALVATVLSQGVQNGWVKIFLQRLFRYASRDQARR